MKKLQLETYNIYGKEYDCEPWEVEVIEVPNNFDIKKDGVAKIMELTDRDEFDYSSSSETEADAGYYVCGDWDDPNEVNYILKEYKFKETYETTIDLQELKDNGIKSFIQDETGKKVRVTIEEL